MILRLTSGMADSRIRRGADSEAAADGSRLTGVLNERLRYGALELREMDANPASILQDVRKILREYLGNPPERFTWNGKIHTPLSFYRSWGIDLREYVMLMHHPSPEWPVGLAYHETKDAAKRDPALTMLSLDMNTIKMLVLRQLENGEPVVIACDVRHCGSRKDGILDLSLANDIPRLSKEEAIKYREIKACHVMSIDGHSRDGYWKVQDSHGTETGTDGHYVMSDLWFDEYVLSAVVKKNYLTPEQRQALDSPEYMPKTEKF